MIRDLSNPNPQPEPIPVEAIPDERLFLDGRIKDLFDRVLTRKKSKWDPMTRTRQPVPKNIAEIQGEENIEKCWEMIEEDCLAHYMAGDVECYVVRVASEKYACEVFQSGEHLDSLVERRFDSLVRYLLNTYPKAEVFAPKEEAVRISPEIMKRKPGRPRVYSQPEPEPIQAEL